MHKLSVEFLIMIVKFNTSILNEDKFKELIKKNAKI